MKRQELELPSDAARRDLQETVTYWALVLSAVIALIAITCGMWVWL